MTVVSITSPDLEVSWFAALAGPIDPVMPNLKSHSLPEVYGRVPANTPAKPPGNGVRR